MRESRIETRSASEHAGEHPSSDRLDRISRCVAQRYNVLMIACLVSSTHSAGGEIARDNAARQHGNFNMGRLMGA